MSQPNHTDNTVHLLSKKSRRLHRDTFFFMPNFTGWLLGGLNQRVTPVTSAKLHRWVRLVDKQALDFELQPVNLVLSGAILQYSKVPTGPRIPPESNAPLPSGDYTWYITDTSSPYYMTPFSGFWDASTFAELKSGAQIPGRLAHLENQLPWYRSPSLLEKQVATRDNEQCLITGSRSNDTDISLTWIIPPAWVDWLDNPQYYENPSAIGIPSNAMMMRNDLIDAFHDNAFGIDVDDDYRLVMFREFGPAGALLKTTTSQAYFRRPEPQVELIGPDDYFLREHFKHCLRVHLLHGDIGADYPRDDIVQALTDLGLWEKDDVAVPFADPRWHTELGKEIFAAHFRHQADSGRYERIAGYEDE